MKKLTRGFSLIEMITVLAVSTILLATTIPLGAYWIESANLSTTEGEMSHGIGKAIAIALRNEQALDRTLPAAALCLSDTNQLSVLQATVTELPNCGADTGTSVWTSAIPDDVTLTENGNDISCLCFNPDGIQTTNNCGGCTVATTVDATIGDHAEVVHVR